MLIIQHKDVLPVGASLAPWRGERGVWSRAMPPNRGYGAGVGGAREAGGAVVQIGAAVQHCLEAESVQRQSANGGSTSVRGGADAKEFGSRVRVACKLLPRLTSGCRWSSPRSVTVREVKVVVGRGGVEDGVRMRERSGALQWRRHWQ